MAPGNTEGPNCTPYTIGLLQVSWDAYIYIYKIRKGRNACSSTLAFAKHDVREAPELKCLAICLLLLRKDSPNQNGPGYQHIHRPRSVIVWYGSNVRLGARVHNIELHGLWNTGNAGQGSLPCGPLWVLCYTQAMLNANGSQSWPHATRVQNPVNAECQDASSRKLPFQNVHRSLFKIRMVRLGLHSWPLFPK